jgi:hypothetical protein
MPNKSQTKSLTVLITALAVLFVSCAPKTDEDRIQELMKEAGKLIEKKDITSLLGLLSDEYIDYRGRDKTQTQDMAQTYFREFRGIVVHVLSTRIEGIDMNEATIQTDVALSSGAAKALRKLVPVSTDNYRFNIILIKKQDRWQIRYAGWKHIGVEELFPESLSILQKLFSDK